MGIGLYRAVYWWLRSPASGRDGGLAYLVITVGCVRSYSVYGGNYCARPALAGKYAEIR